MVKKIKKVQKEGKSPKSTNYYFTQRIILHFVEESFAKVW